MRYINEPGKLMYDDRPKVGSREDNVGLDGAYKGIRQNTGVFAWVLEYISNNGHRVVERGIITLIWKEWKVGVLTRFIRSFYNDCKS